MDSKLVFFFLGLALAVFQTVKGSKNHKLAVYWGQNAVYNLKKEKQYWEKDLEYFCQHSNYDIVILAFMHVFFDGRQKDSLPALNFAYHCETPISNTYPFLLRCPKIEQGIKTCQKNGKKVLLSLGGASGSYGFANDAEAETFADTVWNLILGGNKNKNLRPFGSAIVDGVDLDIEGGSSVGYTAFVRKLRNLEKGASQKCIISAAPQCPFPDGFLGPEPGKALQDAAQLFDEIYIQFYNNYCHTGDEKQFYANLGQWLDYSAKQNGPKIFVGMPSHEKAAYGRGYWRTPAEVKYIYNKIKNESRFGGFMLWDASFDQNNVISGIKYSEHIKAIMGGGGPVPTGGPQTTHDHSTTVAQTTKAPVKPTKPHMLSCANLADGLYAHPKDCAMFMQCLSGVVYEKDCPTGLKFNPKNKLCDWPRNVKC